MAEEIRTSIMEKQKERPWETTSKLRLCSGRYLLFNPGSRAQGLGLRAGNGSLDYILYRDPPVCITNRKPKYQILNVAVTEKHHSLFKDPHLQKVVA